MHIRNLRFTDRPTAWLWIVGAALNIGLWSGTLLTMPRQRPFVPLHYTIYFQTDLAVPTWQLLFLPAFGTIIVILHFVFSKIRPEPIWSRAWMILLILMEFLLACSLTILKLVDRRLL